MPIHTSWKSMLQSMRKTYNGQGDNKCYELSNGTEFCAPEKAWSVFFAKVTEDYGKGAETRPKSRTVQESEDKDKDSEPSELEMDMWIDWYKKLKEKEKNGK